MRFVVPALTLLGLVAACSSSDDADTSAPACAQQAQPGNRACVPGTAKSSTPLTIALDLTSGCLPCFTTMKPCAVSMQGTAITVGMRTETCTPAGDQACPAVCGFASSTCEIPALPAGIYSVTIEGETARDAPRRLHVADDASATSCALPFPAPSSTPIDLTGLATDCTTDADCVAVSATVCALCTCPSAAIAASAKDDFDASYRAASSQCAPPSENVACGACESKKPVCNAAGACELR